MGRQGDEGGRLAALDVLPESSRAGRETGRARVVAGREKRLQGGPCGTLPGTRSTWRTVGRFAREKHHSGQLTGRSLSAVGTRGRAWGKCSGLEPGRGAGVTLRARRPGVADATSVVGTLTSRRRESSVVHADVCQVLFYICKSRTGSIQSITPFQKWICVGLAGLKSV